MASIPPVCLGGGAAAAAPMPGMPCICQATQEVLVAGVIAAIDGGACNNCHHPAANHQNGAQHAAAVAVAAAQPAAAQVPPALSHWWSELGRAVRAAVADPDGVGHGLFTITLQPMADGTIVYWFGISEIGSVLIERREYRTLRDEVIQRWNQHPREHTLIIGTPGIGKTMHLYFLISYLRHQWEVDHAAWAAAAVAAPAPYELVIAYEYLQIGVGRVGYRFRVDINGNATVIAGIGDLAAPADLYYLCDGVTPQLVDKRTLLETSPNEKIYHPFMKRPKAKVVTRYMSVLSYEVMKVIRPILFNNISEDQLRARYAVVGGIIRSIGQLYTEDELVQRLKMAAGTYTAEQLIAGQGGHRWHQKTPEVSDELLHLIVDENDDTKAMLDFSSQKVIKIAMDKQRLGFQRWLKNFLKAASRSKPARMHFGTLGGRLFENVAIRALAAGGSFKIRSQPPPSRHWWNWGSISTQLALPSSPEAQHVDIVDEALDMARALHAAGVMPAGNALTAFRAKLGLAVRAPDPALPATPIAQFGIPASPTFPAIDAFHVQPPVATAGCRGAAQPAVWRLFQMKNVQEDGKREIKVAHLNRFLTYVAAAVVVELYQVVPMPHWPSAKVNPFVYRDDAAVVARPARIHEFVLVVPDDVVEQA